MTNQNATPDDSSLQDRFTFSFRTQSHQVHVSFAEQTLHHTIDSFIDFLLGCGYNPKGIVKSLTAIIKILENRWTDSPE